MRCWLRSAARQGSLLVTDVVLAEAVWTLKSAFDQDKPAQLLAVRSLLDETAFAFEDREAVAAALGLFEVRILRVRGLR
jgi:predicted nucleic-acid-binding protein